MHVTSKSKITNIILTSVILGIMSGIAPESLAQSELQSQVVNSKYITISDHRFRDGDFSDQVTGTVINNSTQDISLIEIFVGVYDSNDQLITMESGFADVTNLPAGDNSSFSISLFGLSNEEIDHYIIYAGGLP